MESDYYIIINTIDGSFTGHVNITMHGPNGWTYTFGNNTTEGSWGVRIEDNSERNPSTVQMSERIYVTYEQLTSMYDWVANILNDPGNAYGLIGQNCVDFVRDVLSIGGLGEQVSLFMASIGTPVTYYAAITDWLDANGFGSIMDGIGATLGAFGELGSMMINAAGAAWTWAGDMATNAWNFVSGLGDAVGGFIGSLADSIADFFLGFGKGNDGGTLPQQPDPLNPVGLRAADDDFLLDGDAIPEGWMLKDAPSFSGPWAGEPDALPLFSVAQDEMSFDLALPLPHADMAQDAYAFA